MDTDRIHRAVSNDGTEIVGRVHGQGPPLVLVHGGLEDGDLDWTPMLPFLAEDFTCYLMSTRGRGLSGVSADLAPGRLLEDVVSFVNSIGEPVMVFGGSDGATRALAAAAYSDAIFAVAAYEPIVSEVMTEDHLTMVQAIVGRVGEAVAEDRLADAARIFGELVANDDETASLEASGYFVEAGRYMPVYLQELEQASHSDAPSPTDPTLLAKISAPVLLLHGSETAGGDFYSDGLRHVVEHVADTRVRQIEGAGHFSAALVPQRIAEEVTRFFKTASGNGPLNVEDQ
jgi:pimeloyl-ACP methyl ester carboxylesterase